MSAELSAAWSDTTGVEGVTDVTGDRGAVDKLGGVSSIDPAPAAPDPDELYKLQVEVLYLTSTSDSTQNRSFWLCSSEPASWLST